MDAARLRAHRRALVHLAEYSISLARPAVDGRRGIRLLVRPHERPRRNAVYLGRGAVSPWLPRPRNIQRALSGSTVGDGLGGGRRSAIADLYAGRRTHHAAADPRLHSVRLLDISRQSARRRGIPLGFLNAGS